MRLTIKQTLALDYLEDEVTTELYYGGAAGGGKSALGCYWQMKRRIKYPGTKGLLGRASLKTLKETTLQTFFDIAEKQELKRGKHFDLTSAQDKEFPNCIVFQNGSLIYLKDLYDYPSDPDFDELGSLEITDGFIDEAPQVSEKGKNIVRSRIRYRLDEFGLMPKLLMSGNPSKNWAYRDFYKPYKKGELRHDKRFIQALPGDNPNLPKSYIESLRGLDKNSRERLLEGNWEYSDDPAILIEYDKILDCFTNGYVEPGENYITCDVARFGRDSSVIGLWSGCRVKLFQFRKLSITALAEKIKSIANLNSVPISRIIADEDGVGGGVVDILRCKGFVNNSVALRNPVVPMRDHKGNAKPENYSNLKSQCYFKLAEFINAGKVYIECDNIEIKSSVIQELEQVKQYKMDKDGKKAILPKDKVKEIIGRSPDFSDTLMMRMFFELKTKKTWVSA